MDRICLQQHEQTAVYYGEFPSYPRLFHITLATQISLVWWNEPLILHYWWVKVIVSSFGCPRYFSRHYLSRKCAGMQLMMSRGRKEGGTVWLTHLAMYALNRLELDGRWYYANWLCTEEFRLEQFVTTAPPHVPSLPPPFLCYLLNHSHSPSRNLSTLPSFSLNRLNPLSPPSPLFHSYNLLPLAWL